ncbi:hypothetical protein [Nocardioides sp. Leaf285]|nr:hypothetical protein [Nocardioides sp. Leaf285]
MMERLYATLNGSLATLGVPVSVDTLGELALALGALTVLAWCLLHLVLD